MVTHATNTIMIYWFFAKSASRYLLYTWKTETSCIPTKSVFVQGPRSNFEIGGAPLVTRYWGGGVGGTKHFFLLILYNFRNIGGGGARAPPPPPTPRSLMWPYDKSAIIIEFHLKPQIEVVFRADVSGNRLPRN